MTILEITFQNEISNETMNIHYQLLDNTVVTKFVNLINEINSKEFVETRYNNYSIYCNNLNNIKNEKYTQLIENIHLFEKENNNGYKFENRFELIEITQEKLNALHSEFETYLVIFRKGVLLTNKNNNDKVVVLKNSYDLNKIIKYLNNVNNLIHNLESILLRRENSKVASGHFSSYLFGSPMDNRNILLDDDEYKLFTVNIKWGELFLGYGTTGKSLFHIFKDNDIKLLEQKFNLSPQEYVTSNIIGVFSQTRENYYDDFKKWCIENKINELYNIDFENIKNASGYIKLGDLINEDTKEDFLSNLIKYTNIIGYRILMSNLPVKN